MKLIHAVNYQDGISMDVGAAAPFGGQVLSKGQDFPPGLGRNLQKLHGEKKIQQDFQGQIALEAEIVSCVHQLIGFKDRLSPALNPSNL